MSDSSSPQSAPHPPRGIGVGKKVVVAMSGGVDSSAAAALLKSEGYDVVGCFMRLGSPDEAEVADGYDNLAGADDDCTSDVNVDPNDSNDPDAAHLSPGGNKPRAHKQGCCSVNDAADARRVAAMLDIPFYVVNFRKDFGRIMDYFVAEYHAGRTPNPCVRCNDWLKFGRLHAYARSIDADYIASGHYAQLSHEADGSVSLRRGVDAGKDQSYVLFGSPVEQLREMLLPVGGLPKSQVRQIAQDYGLPVFNKPDSQEICFVPDQDYARLVKRRDPDRVQPGPVLNPTGEVIGEHPGHQHYTVGQRRRLNLKTTGPRSLPLYVLSRDAETNTLTVGPRDALGVAACTADQTNWLVDPPKHWRSCHVKVRYNGGEGAGEVRMIDDDVLEVRFETPIDAVTPGQPVVCYDGDRVLGGGWVRDVTPAASATS